MVDILIFSGGLLLGVVVGLVVFSCSCSGKNTDIIDGILKDNEQEVLRLCEALKNLKDENARMRANILEAVSGSKCS